VRLFVLSTTGWPWRVVSSGALPSACCAPFPFFLSPLPLLPLLAMWCACLIVGP
jgi:hypothetical protein